MRPALEQLARRQLADYDAARPGSAFGEPGLHLTVAEAYELQLRVTNLRQSRGEVVAGYKVGCVSRAVQGQLRIAEPAFGHVFASEIYRSGVSLDVKRFDQPAIEGEFALRLAQDIPDAEWLAKNVEQAIDATFPVIELHNYVCRAPLDERVQELIANNGMHAGVVLAEKLSRLSRAEELLEETITVKRNGTVLGATNGNELPGGPPASLLWLVERLKTFGKTLRRGQIVLAGSPLPLYAAEAGDRFEVNCSRLAGVTLMLLPEPTVRAGRRG